MSTFAGNGASTDRGDGGPAISAGISFSKAIGGNTVGTIYVGIQYGVRYITSSGIINKFAGQYTSGGYAGDDGKATNAYLNSVTFITADTVGRVYISDGSGDMVRIVGTDGIISRYIGGGSDYSDSPTALNAVITAPGGLFVDSSTRDVYYTQSLPSVRVRKMDGSSSILTTLAGLGSSTANDVPGTSTSIASLDGLCVSTTGNIYYVEFNGSKVRKLYIPGSPSLSPTYSPTAAPSNASSVLPTVTPSFLPSVTPTIIPTWLRPLSPL